MRKLLIALAAFALPVLAFAAEGEASKATDYMKLGYFLAMGLAAYGGTASQSRAASAALEGIARNPGAADKIQTPMILALALMESLVIFTLISTFLA